MLQRRPNSLICLWLLLMLLIPAGIATAQPATQPRRPNVLLIIADDLRPELNCYGARAVKSPNIDGLAARGTKFDLAYCQYPVCNPSRVSLLTGLRPDATRVLDNTTAFRQTLPDIVTLPQHFRASGYFSAGLGKVFHRGGSLQDVRREMDDPRSFDELKYFNSTPAADKGEGRNVTGGKIDWCRWLAADGTDDDQPDGQIAAEAIRLMEQHKHAPFFIVAGFHKPHDPFVAPRKYFDLYPLTSLTLYTDPADATPLVPHAISGRWKEVFAGFTDQDKRELQRAYYAGVSFVDAQIGKLLDALNRFDLTNNTIVILLGDHGYHLGERQWWNKNTLFEFSCRVPLIVLIPGAKPAGQSCRQPVELVDVFPTLIDYCGLTAPHKLAGTSLRPLLEEPTASSGNKPARTQVQRGKISGRTVRTDRWRYTEWDQGRQGVELYDQHEDPGNYRNLSDQTRYKDVIARLKPLL